MKVKCQCFENEYEEIVYSYQLGITIITNVIIQNAYAFTAISNLSLDFIKHKTPYTYVHTRTHTHSTVWLQRVVTWRKDN